jgi:threonine dehydrogenase-like Zn-dependent dehydrogenase
VNATEPEPEGDPVVVPMLRVRCNQCRRARSRFLANQRKGGAGEPRLGGFVPVCTHYETVWAPGFGPGSEPPEDSGWEARPEGPV